MKSGFANPFILLGIALLLLLGGLVVYQKVFAPKVNPAPAPTASPTPDPTANWKTYTNTKYNYLVQYPSNTNLTFLDCSNSVNPNSKDTFILVQKENSGCEGQGEGWVISSGENQTCNSTESWKSISTPITINNVDANKCVSIFIGKQLYPGPTERISVVFSKIGTPVSLILSDSKYSQLFDQILSTFKFLD